MKWKCWVFFFGLIYFNGMAMLWSQASKAPVFLPLGDSYTICEGLKEAERWPNLLEARFKQKNIPLALTENPSRTGYTTQDLIQHELPYLKSLHPDIVTILIGVNDYVRGYDTGYFHTKLIYIIDQVEKELKNPDHIILLSIPDYSVTPKGAYYANGRDVNGDLKIWNAIIQLEAKKRKLPFVDIFPLTLEMKDHPELVSKDGLHPSAKEVDLWSKLIEPEMEKLIKTYY